MTKSPSTPMIKSEMKQKQVVEEPVHLQSKDIQAHSKYFPIEFSQEASEEEPLNLNY